MSRTYLKILLVIDWLTGARDVRVSRRRKLKLLRAYQQAHDFLSQILDTSKSHSERVWARDEQFRLSLEMSRVSI